MTPRVLSAHGSARAQVAVWLILTAVVAWLSLRGWGTLQVGVYQDDAVYVVLARAIAAGERYGLINEPGPASATKFPFGFPLALAPVVRVFPEDPLVCTAVSLGATLLNISLLFWGWPLLGRGSSRWWGLGGAALYGVTPLVIGQTRAVLSDPLFTSFVLLALLLTEAQVRAGGARGWRLAALGVVLMLAVATRWIGVIVCAAVLLRLMWSLGWQVPRALARTLAGALGSLALVLLLTPIDLQQLLPGQHLVSRQARLQRLRDRPGRAETSRQTPAHYFTTEVRSVLVAAGGGDRERDLARRLGVPALPAAFGIGMSALVVAGAWLGVRRRLLAPSIVLFEALYTGALLLWPFIAIRLLYPLVPFLFVQLLIAVHAVAGAAAAWRGAPPRCARQAAVVVFALLFALALIKSVRVEPSLAMTGDLRAGAAWLARHAPADAVVLAEAPQTTFLYAQRATIPYPQVDGGAALDQLMSDRGIDYLLLAPELKWRLPEERTYSPYVRRTLLPAVAKLTERGRLTLVHEAPGEPMVRVYRVAPAPR